MALCPDYPCVGMQSFPNRFALKPLKWLRFLAYTIYGREGHISLTNDGSPVDYESGVTEGSSYHFIADGMSFFISLARLCSSHARKRNLGF